MDLTFNKLSKIYNESIKDSGVYIFRRKKENVINKTITTFTCDIYYYTFDEDKVIKTISLVGTISSKKDENYFWDKLLEEVLKWLLDKDDNR